MRFRKVLPAALLTLAAIPGAALARPDKPEAQGDPAPAPWMVKFDASKDVRIGIDESELLKWVDVTHKGDWRKAYGKSWNEQIWPQTCLLQTPSFKTDVPAFSLSKYELTNSQWARFLEARRETFETKADDTLRAIVMTVWRIPDDGKSEKQITRGVLTLVVANWEALQPALDAKAPAKWDPKAKWDAQQHRAGETKLPEGLKLRYTRYMPPDHWSDDGSVPEWERKRPMRAITWEQATDFCRWAGFHLPTEFEWERAARGIAGRMFAWEGDWDPLKAVWHGYNAVAIAAKKPEFPPTWTVPATQKDPPRDSPGPMDVDQLVAGATPEGIHHMLGNVSELTLSTLTLYRGTKSTNPFQDGKTIIARGANFEDRAEVLLASDRIWDGHNGALLKSHAVGGLGFRLASYPAEGADLAVAFAARWNDIDASDGPGLWMPYPAGCSDKKESAPFAGIEAQRTAGVLQRQLANESADFTFVAGPATGIAFAPVKGLPLEHVKTVDDYKRFANSADAPVCLGILTGTENASFEIVGPDGVKTWLSFDDPRFTCENDQLVQTREHIGAVLMLDGDHVQVHRPNGTLRSKAKYREAPLGTLAIPVEFAVQSGAKDPTGKLEGDVAELSTTLPYLDKKGNALTGSAAKGIRVTLKVPFKRTSDK